MTERDMVCMAEGMTGKNRDHVDHDCASKVECKGQPEAVNKARPIWADKVHCHREGYARYPVLPDEFLPILDAQVWPEDSEEKIAEQ